MYKVPTHPYAYVQRAQPALRSRLAAPAPCQAAQQMQTDISSTRLRRGGFFNFFRIELKRLA